MENEIKFKCYVCDSDFESYLKLSVHINRKHEISYKDIREKYYPKVELEFKCNKCEKSFDKYDSMRVHISKIHKIPSEQTFVDYKLNGIRRTCACGCNEFTSFNGHEFLTYAQGHQSRVHNNWGHNQKAIDKSSETRRQQYASGERKVWNDGLTKDSSEIVNRIGEMSKKENNPSRAKKISKALLGIPKSKEHNEKNTAHWKEYWSKPENREKQRVRQSKYIKSRQIKNNTVLEKKFKHMLNTNGIDYEFQYIVNGYNYDFYIKNTNILIEIDGDFWHCNPIKWKEPMYEVQRHTIKHDIIKNENAQSNGYKLLRFWETDINENPAKVMKQLLNELNI